jgi:hypothetical protein
VRSRGQRTRTRSGRFRDQLRGSRRAMVVLDFLGQGQRAEPPRNAKPSPPPDDPRKLSVHRQMILESGPSPRHERGFVTKINQVRDRSSARRTGNAVQAPIRFSKQNCGGSNQNGTVFSPHNIATPPEADEEMSARESERVRAAIAEARSARPKPLPRYKQPVGKPLPAEARSMPRAVPVELNSTTSHVIGTLKPVGAAGKAPALPRLAIDDPDTVRRLRGAAFAAFQRNPVSGVRTAKTDRAERRRRRAQAAELAAAGMARKDAAADSARTEAAAKAAAAVARAKEDTAEANAARAATQRSNTRKPEPPLDPRFPPARSVQQSGGDRKDYEGVPAGVSSWSAGKQHPAVPREPADAPKPPPSDPLGGAPRQRSVQQQAQMMNTLDRKAKLSHLEKRIKAEHSAVPTH